MKNRFLIAVALLALSPLAHATPMTWNGNTYDIFHFEGSLTWDEARMMAESMGGHLVTITSEAENDFVSSLVSDYGVGNRERYWLGGYQHAAGTGATYESDPSAGWAWVTGEEWAYTNWAANEPNNGVGGTQHWLHYWPSAGLWDDMENRAVMDGFVIEYEVPEPGSLALLGLGLLGLGIARRRLTG